MNEHRDTLVGDALRRFDVPDHASDFWTRLDTELAGGPAGADDLDRDERDADIVELGAAPSRRRTTWLRRPMLVAAAVVAAVALAVGAAVLRPGGDDESQLDVAETPGEVDADPDGSDAPAPETTAPAPETTSTTAPEAIEEAEAEQVAATWLDALSDGDMDGAYDQLDLASKSRMDRAGFEGVSSGLSEGAAAFARPGLARAVTILDAADASFAVVSFTGDVEREGMVETATYPVVVTPTGVHFVLDGPQLELDPEYLRTSGTTLTSPLEVIVSEAALAWVWTDDGEPEPLEGRGPVSLDVEAIAGPGTHIVHLVAFEGGAITARSHTVVVP